MRSTSIDVDSFGTSARRLYAFGRSNTPLLVGAVALTALFLVMRNALTKIVLRDLTEFELYFAKALVGLAVQPLVMLLLWRSGKVDVRKMSSMSLENKAIIFGSFVVGMLIFAVSVYVLKNHKLTHVVTLHTAFQIIIACLVGYSLLKEKMSVHEYVGVGLIVAGMLVMYARPGVPKRV